MLFLLSDLCFRRRRMKNLMTNLMTKKEPKLFNHWFCKGMSQKWGAFKSHPLVDSTFLPTSRFLVQITSGDGKGPPSLVGWRLTQVGLLSFYVCAWSPDLFGCFQKSWYPQIINLNRVFHYKPSILAYPYFWKHPFEQNNVIPLPRSESFIDRPNHLSFLGDERWEVVVSWFVGTFPIYPPEV